MDITPINGCILVKLTNSYEYVAAPDKKYDTKTSGIVVGGDWYSITGNDDVDHVHAITDKYIGKKVYFEEYKDGTQFEQDGDKYALIKFEDVRGLQNA